MRCKHRFRYSCNVIRRGIVVIASALTASVAGLTSQEDIASRLLREPAVQTAMEATRASEAQVLADQVRLCEIPAPPFKEGDRAKTYADAFRTVGLKNVRLDREGNVLGERPGQLAHPHVVFAAHLDTVFPEGTDVAVTRDGSMLRGPGIADNCRGLAVLLGIARALDAAGVQTSGSLTFVGTVGEEGLGDLRGARTLFNDTLSGRVDYFVGVDGGGTTITNVGVGSRRFRVAFKGPGGHSYGNFGMPNPLHALGRAIAAISDLPVPREPRTTFSVGRVGGGTSVNAIPTEAWMEVDLRSEDPAALTDLVTRFHNAVDGALAAENTRRSPGAQLSVVKQVVGERPAGRTALDSPIVAIAIAVTRALRLPAVIHDGSTDANIPMSLNIPAITIEGGGTSARTHSPGEYFDATNSWQGTQRAVLLAIALTQK